MPARALPILALCLCLLALVAPAAVGAPADPLAAFAASADALRASEGLAPLTPASDPGVEALAGTGPGEAQALMAAERSGLDYLCRPCLPGWSTGADGRPGRYLVSVAGWSAARLLAAAPEAASALLDPRAVSLAAALGADGTIVARVAVDPARPFTAPVAYPGRLASGESRRLVALAPPGSSATLSLAGPGGELRSGRDFMLAQRNGAAGATLLSSSIYGPPPPLAYRARYRVRVGGRPAGVLVTSGPAPGRPRLVGLRAAERRIILTAVRRAPAPVREIWRGLGDRLTLRRGEGSCGPLTACTDSVRGQRLVISFSPEHLADRGTLAFTAMHELGHAADRGGLTDHARALASRAMRTGGRWRCVIDPSRVDPDLPRSQWCLSDAEQFADDFARYATRRPRAEGGYSFITMIGRRAMGRLLAGHLAPRPASLGPDSWRDAGVPAADDVQPAGGPSGAMLGS